MILSMFECICSFALGRVVKVFVYKHMLQHYEWYAAHIVGSVPVYYFIFNSGPILVEWSHFVHHFTHNACVQIIEVKLHLCIHAHVHSY